MQASLASPEGVLVKVRQMLSRNVRALLVSAVAVCAFAGAAAFAATLIDAPWSASAIRAAAPVDTTPPVSTITGAPSGWVTHDVTVTIEAQDTGSGVAHIYYQVNASYLREYTGPLAFKKDTSSRLYVYAVDNAGNQEDTQTVVVRVDKHAPVVTTNAQELYVDAAAIEVFAVDMYSGVDHVTYSLDGEATATIPGYERTLPTVTALGWHTVTVTAVDKAGNVSALNTYNFLIESSAKPDLNPPRSTLLGTSDGWSRTPPELSIFSTDQQSGVTAIHYSVDGGPETAYTAPFSVTKEGTTTIDYRAEDASGNVEATRSATVRYDGTPPSSPDVTVTVTGARGLILSWSASTDAYSGFAKYQVRENDTIIAETSSTALVQAGLEPASTHNYWVRALDVAGNASPWMAIVVGLPGDPVVVPVPPGDSVVVTVPVTVPGTDGTETTKTIDVTIGDVTQGGDLTVVEIPAPSVAPAGTEFTGINYDFDFSGRFRGRITVAIPYDSRLPLGRARRLMVRGWDGHQWIAIPAVVDTVHRRIILRLPRFMNISIVEPIGSSAARILLSKTSFTLRYGQYASFTAKLLDSKGVGVAGFPLWLERYDGGQWRRVGRMSAVSGVRGLYRWSGRAFGGFRTRMRVVIGDSAIWKPRAVSLTLMPQARVVPPTVSASNRPVYVIGGALAPAHAGPVTLEVWRLVNGRWVHTRTLTATSDPTGRWRMNVVVIGGTYRFRALHRDGNHAPSASALSANVVVR